jgi:hypothetical protein
LELLAIALEEFAIVQMESLETALTANASLPMLQSKRTTPRKVFLQRTPRTLPHNPLRTIHLRTPRTFLLHNLIKTLHLNPIKIKTKMLIVLLIIMEMMMKGQQSSDSVQVVFTKIFIPRI